MSCLLPSCFSTETLYVFLISPVLATCRVHLTLIWFYRQNNNTAKCTNFLICPTSNIVSACVRFGFTALYRKFEKIRSSILIYSFVIQNTRSSTFVFFFWLRLRRLFTVGPNCRQTTFIIMQKRIVRLGNTISAILRPYILYILFFSRRFNELSSHNINILVNSLTINPLKSKLV